MRRRPRPRRERPAASVLYAECRGAPAAGPAENRFALGRRHEQRSQSRETIGNDETEGNEFGERLLDLRAQQAGPVHQLLEEGRPVVADGAENRAGPEARFDRRFACGQGAPLRRVPPREQRDRRGPYRPGTAFGAVRPSAARPQPRPGETSGKTAVVEPSGLVARRSAPAGFPPPTPPPRPRSLRVGRRFHRRRRAPPSASRERRAATPAESAENHGR